MINIQQPLKFYSSNGLQLRHKQALTGYKNIPTLRVSATSLVPFILQREKSVADIEEWYDPVNIDSIVAHNILTGETVTLTSYLSIKYGVQSITGEESAYDFALYDGESTIPAGTLNNGRYELHITDEDSNTFYSETFRVWDPEYSVKFEFRNSDSFNNMWFYPSGFYYEMEFEGVTFGKGEYDEFLNTLPDINNHIGAKTQQRKDKIMTASFMCDNIILDSIHLMEMCDEIYLTDELGSRNKIEIFGITPEQSDSGDHIHINIDYRIIDNILTKTSQTITYISESKNGSTITKETGVFIGGKKIHIGGKKIKL